MSTQGWITNFGFSIKQLREVFNKSKPEQKYTAMALGARHFVTAVETAKSTHKKLNQYGY